MVDSKQFALRGFTDAKIEPGSAPQLLAVGILTVPKPITVVVSTVRTVRLDEATRADANAAAHAVTTVLTCAAVDGSFVPTVVGGRQNAALPAESFAEVVVPLGLAGAACGPVAGHAFAAAAPHVDALCAAVVMSCEQAAVRLVGVTELFVGVGRATREVGCADTLAAAAAVHYAQVTAAVFSDELAAVSASEHAQIFVACRRTGRRVWQLRARVVPDIGRGVGIVTRRSDAARDQNRVAQDKPTDRSPPCTLIVCHTPNPMPTVPTAYSSGTTVRAVVVCRLSR